MCKVNENVAQAPEGKKYEAKKEKKSQQEVIHGLFIEYLKQRKLEKKVDCVQITSQTLGSNPIKANTSTKFEFLLDQLSLLPFFSIKYISGFISKLRKIDYEEGSASPRKSPIGSPRRSMAAKRTSVIGRRRGSIMDEIGMRLKELEGKSLLPYTEERTALVLPSSYAVQFEKTAIHERMFPLAVEKEREIKIRCLSNGVNWGL